MKSNFKKMKCLSILVMFTVVTVCSTFPSYGETASVNGFKTTFVTVDMNDQSVKPTMLTAGNNLSSADSVANMARNKGCFAAINGTYFSAYDGVPVPWGTIIKNGKVLHVSNGGSVAGFTGDGKLIIDRLSFHFKGYINGEHRSIPWRINHPSTENDAITIFTPEYGKAVKVAAGGKAPVVVNGKVSYIATADFTVPAGGFAILYNPQVANLVDERFKVGDEVRYEVEIQTTFTKQSSWNNVIEAVGAGPSLIINGQITADGVAEQFTEAKINTQKAGRTFIGAGSDGKVKIGIIQSATIKEAAAVCQSMGLVNAMCLDGGGSIGLYSDGKALATGRNVNNAMGFIYTAPYKLIKPVNVNVTVDQQAVTMECYNIGGNNYFKLRDIAKLVDGSSKNFDVSWDNEQKAVNLLSETKYNAVGGELSFGDGSAKKMNAGIGKIFKDGEEVKLTAYEMGGNNYFKLREITALFDIAVGFDSQGVIIDTKESSLE